MSRNYNIVRSSARLFCSSVVLLLLLVCVLMLDLIQFNENELPDREAAAASQLDWIVLAIQFCAAKQPVEGTSERDIPAPNSLL